MLAFGRKHDAKPARVDLGPAVAGLREMLTRVIRDDIQLTIEVESGDRAPSSSIPTISSRRCCNLVINARDALPAGGAIHIDVAREAIDGDDAPPTRRRRPATTCACASATTASG